MPLGLLGLYWRANGTTRTKMLKIHGQSAVPMQPRMVDEIWVLLITAMIFFYPIVSGAVLSIFTCINSVENSPDHGWWIRDMNIPCYKGDHLVLALTLGLFGLLICVVFPPVLMLYMLYKRRGARLYEERTKVKYLFLYHSY